MNSADRDEKIARPCPCCGMLVDFSDNPYRPFCSRRCKMSDLKAWFTQEYFIMSIESRNLDLRNGNDMLQDMASISGRDVKEKNEH